ncbi:hypothetical protein L596_015440 [Steinernema carpocapsae]|uniref:Uncharacterized protein n=1 Tax=Steinernema carpocapsae TaxID=34508 RepID=A0A4U5NFK8_STECR|nr:hypothetical protein L596_015440 [Steinernema carpocapsae]
MKNQISSLLIALVSFETAGTVFECQLVSMFEQTCKVSEVPNLSCSTFCCPDIRSRINLRDLVCSELHCELCFWEPFSKWC